MPVLGVIGVAGTLFALGLGWSVLSLERARVNEDFEASAREHGAALETGWSEQFHAVDTLATVFITSEEVTREEFGRASERILARHPSIRALEWVPRVPAAQRQAFVEDARRDIPGYAIVDRAPDGGLRPVGHRHVYYPIHYVEPLESNREALGFDPAGNDARNEALQRSARTGTLAVSEATPLVQDDPRQTALLVFSPVYAHSAPTATTDQRVEALEGLAEGVFMVDALIADSLSATESHGIALNVFAMDDGTRKAIGAYRPDGAPLPWYTGGMPEERTWEWSVGGRMFRAVVSPVGLPYAYDLRAPLAVFLLALLLTGSVVGVIGLLMQRERRMRVVAELRQDQLQHQATHDSLTGLVNRGAFELRLEGALESAVREGVVYSLCYMDLDEFKLVNDIHGHQAGDDLIRQIVGRLTTHMREGDVFSRLGGDELGVLLSDCSAEEGRRIAQNLQAVINEYRFQYEDQTVAVGVSIGVTEINAQTTSVGTALGQADAACNIAKEQGRNRVHVFRTGDSVSDQFRSQMLWAAELRQALDENRLELLGQRIVPTREDDGEDMLEVLVRMRDRNGELVAPGVFIPAAERYNLMSSVDRWVIDRALQAKDAMGARQSVWCINLSGHSLGEDGLFEHISELLSTHRVSPREICFEITETAVVRSLSRAERFVGQLRRIGCLVALDDFGSGMSSFTYLKHLPVDFLKIDGAFVRNIQNSRMDRAMVHAIQQIANELGIRTIAEYVETATAQNEVRTLGVHYVQGYYLGRPEPLETLRSRQYGVVPPATGQ
ncbi:EAL domain-containing protein [Ectothiorhodospiraceae bacterium WFHF3C12]|nr:EAL domain-containing protein [Ectothiorhodospiraceae bacterium WFHF3C12]